MSMQYSGDNVTFPDGSVQNTASNGTGFKNRIINGAMMIDQRNAGASVTIGPTNFSVDRWQGQGQTSAYTLQQNAGSVTPPSGFTKYLGATSLAATTVTSTATNVIRQHIEGYNIADLGWGASGASSVTLSFWVRSSLTGSFGVALMNAAENYSYPILYTISSANTWEYKTITIPGPTSGTWATDNTAGIKMWFGIGVGSTYSGTSGSWAGAAYYGVTGATNVVSTNEATFYITGVQLEKGSTATSFDYRPYGTELALCQRYYQTGVAGAAGGAGGGSGSGYLGGYAAYQVVMRAAGTLTQSNQNYSSVYNNTISIGAGAMPSNTVNGFGHSAIVGGGASVYWFTYTSNAEL